MRVKSIQNKSHEFSGLSPLYDEYSSKGFDIVAIYAASKEDTENWMKAIVDENLRSWCHVKIAESMAAGNETSHDTRSNYYIQAIPRNILIERDVSLILGLA